MNTWMCGKLLQTLNNSAVESLAAKVVYATIQCVPLHCVHALQARAVSHVCILVLMEFVELWHSVPEKQEGKLCVLVEILRRQSINSMAVPGCCCKWDCHAKRKHCEGIKLKLLC